MNRDSLVDNTIDIIKQLPDAKIREVNDFAGFLLSRTGDKIIREGAQELTSQSKAFDFLNDEDDLYTVNDVEERYNATPIILLTKEKINNTIKTLPDSFTIDELIEQLIFMEKVEEGFKQSEEGKVISNEDVKIMIDQWSDKVN
ncbi:MAG: hypothetical protein NTY07_05375 [Bacteroidia bacterium]|nr:hypothetical protein [Bacteroidia bacterium]